MLPIRRGLSCLGLFLLLQQQLEDLDNLCHPLFRVYLPRNNGYLACLPKSRVRGSYVCLLVNAQWGSALAIHG